MHGRPSRLAAGLATRRLAQLAHGSDHVVAGPWTGPVDVELMFWIPMLRWLTRHGGVDRKRVIAVSRGGADRWYRGIAGRYVDLLDHFSREQVLEWEEQGGGPSTRELAGLVDADGATWLTPSVLDDLAVDGPTGLRSFTVQQAFEPRDEQPRIKTPYAAIHVDFNDSFPSTAENRRLMDRVVTRLGERLRVALLGVSDGAPAIRVVADGRIEWTRPIPPRHALEVQTHVVRHAELFVATHGGLSFLGPYTDTPTIGIYSHARFDAARLDEFDRIVRELSERRALYRARHAGYLAAARAS
jgi:hypothetical protein